MFHFPKVNRQKIQDSVIPLSICMRARKMANCHLDSAMKNCTINMSLTQTFLENSCDLLQEYET